MPTPQTRHGLTAVLAAGSLLLVGACGRPVEVTAPSGADESACHDASTAWPATVSSLTAVDVSSTSPAVRAWGDPAVIARCGVAEPGPSTDCLTVNGVDWVVTDLSDGRKFVTFGRSPSLEVLVPARYAPEGALLPAFTDAASRLPQTGRRCT